MGVKEYQFCEKELVLLRDAMADLKLDEIATSAQEKCSIDCADFIQANLEDLQEYAERLGDHPEYTAWERAGHDFWLTRNGHGAGFWDRGLGDLGDRLSNAAHVYGSVDPYVGDDNLVHFE